MLYKKVGCNSKRLKIKIEGTEKNFKTLHLKIFRRHFLGQCLIYKERIDTTQSAIPAKFESKTSEASECTCICKVTTFNSVYHGDFQYEPISSSAFNKSLSHLVTKLTLQLYSGGAHFQSEVPTDSQ